MKINAHICMNFNQRLFMNTKYYEESILILTSRYVNGEMQVCFKLNEVKTIC